MVVKNFKFKIKNQDFNFEVKELNSLISHASGLMFKKNSLPLLFIFNKPKKIPIHSFFCKKFVAIWFIDNKIIDIKLVCPNKLSIKPKEKFNKLLEIPENSTEFKKILKLSTSIKI